MIRAGFAQRVITPDVPLPFGEVRWCGESAGVHDDIYIRAVYLEGDEDFLILVLDLMFVFRRLAEEMRRRIATITGMRPERIMIVATQNHSGVGMYDGADDYKLPPRTGPFGAWLTGLLDDVVLAAVAARRDTAGTTVCQAHGQAPGIAANRRPRDKNGRVVMTWHRPAPEIIADWGEADDEVTVLRFDREGEGRFDLLFTFSCHPNTAWATRKFSADYYGNALARVGEHHPHCRGLFLNGACGDIDPTRYMQTPKDAYNAPQAFAGDQPVDAAFDDVARFGAILGGELLRLLPLASPVPVSRIVSRRRCFEAEVHPSASPAVERTVELQAVALGETAAFIGIPGEPFLQVARELDAVGAFPRVFVVGHANGYCGYMPMASQVRACGYGVGPDSVPLGPDIGDRLVAEGTALLRELRDAVTKTPAPVAAAGATV